jgi:hypothetical protein
VVIEAPFGQYEFLIEIDRLQRVLMERAEQSSQQQTHVPVKVTFGQNQHSGQRKCHEQQSDDH